MSKIAYTDWRPRAATWGIVDSANEIIEDIWGSQGFEMTVRQLYYQFIGRDVLPDDWIDEEYNLAHNLAPNTKNTPKNYGRLKALITKARMAGFIDWDAIEDRTRSLTSWRTFDSAAQAIWEARAYFTLEKWERQPCYVEVWIEKEALSGVFERICSELEVPFFACRGYASVTSQHVAARRLEEKIAEGKQVTIFHFGDHDPSGVDMTRDTDDKMRLFEAYGVEVDRRALNIDQCEGLPPNPAKFTDARAAGYIEEYGLDSWELDALSPSALSELVRDAVYEVRDADLWSEAVADDAKAKTELQAITDHYSEIAEYAVGLGS